VALGALLADGVADRALQVLGAQALLDEEIGGAQRGRLEVDTTRLAGEHDHGRHRAGGERLADELQPASPAEPVVDQVDVVALLEDRRQRVLVGRRSVHPDGQLRGPRPAART
jgi:hypothetical protein